MNFGERIGPVDEKSTGWILLCYRGIFTQQIPMSVSINVAHFTIKIKCVSFVTGNLHTLFYTLENT